MCPVFRKPEGTIRPGGNFFRVTGWLCQGELADLTGWGDAPDLIATIVGKPEVAFGSRNDLLRLAVVSWQKKLGYFPGRSDPPNLVVIEDGKPEGTIRPGESPGARLWALAGRTP
jgi:hypothetical protein